MQKRGNAEIQRRAQEVIERCWALGDKNPIVLIHDVGAGGLSTPSPKSLRTRRVAAAALNLRDVPSAEPGMSPMEIWCNEAQERYVLAVDPNRLAVFSAIAKRERSPFAVIGDINDSGRLLRERSALRQQSGGHAHRRAARQAAAHDPRCEDDGDARQGARSHARRSKGRRVPRAAIPRPSRTRRSSSPLAIARSAA